MYYIAVSCGHVLNVLMITLAPAELKLTGESFSQAMATLLVCRLVINLRKRNCRVQQAGGDDDGVAWARTDVPSSTRSGTSNLTSLVSIAHFFDIEMDVRRASHVPSLRSNVERDSPPVPGAEGSTGTAQSVRSAPFTVAEEHF